MDISQHMPLPPMSRREMLCRCCAGFGGLALASLISEAAAASLSAVNPLAPKAPHFTPRAKRMIFLFMHGGPSHVDLFDYRPVLQQYDNKPLPIEKPRVEFSGTENALGSPFSFKQHGQSGAWVSELFPSIAKCVDDLCFIKSLHGTNPAHGGAIMMLQTGSAQFVRPTMGSWISYGLGTENSNMPSFITISPPRDGGVRNYSAAFLPAAHTGTPIGITRMSAGEGAIDHLTNPNLPRESQRKQLDLLQKLEAEQLKAVGPNRELEGRIQSFELAFRMQTEAPEIMDIGGESKATRKLYGLDEVETRDFGYRCLLARRLSEGGVRFIQATHGGNEKWDHHTGLYEGITRSSKEVDKPIAGLLKDLKSRGLLDETLVLWGGEFGRTPAGEVGENHNGRDHNPHGFTMFMAGGGVKPGFSYGETDDFGYYALKDKVHVHDLHATLLHCLGLDHEKLTYRHQGRDFRLTDVEGHVIHEILA